VGFLHSKYPHPSITQFTSPISRRGQDRGSIPLRSHLREFQQNGSFVITYPLPSFSSVLGIWLNLTSFSFTFPVARRRVTTECAPILARVHIEMRTPTGTAAWLAPSSTLFPISSE
jgi:hypothetical protein